LRKFLVYLLPAIILGVIIIAERKKADSGQESPSELPLVRTFTVMGTIAELKLYGDPETANLAADKISEKFSEVERVCSIFNPESEISALNRTAYDKPFQCGDLLWGVIDQSRKIHEMTDGAFDITATPLMELWGFYRKRQTLPSEDEIQTASKKVGLDKVIFDDSTKSVKFTVPDMRLDLGGIAKGYAVDLAADEARRLGIRSGTINLGGNIFCLENPPPVKELYSVGVKNPLDKDRICGTVKIRGRGVATSGNYEKYVVIGNTRFTHIMNPKTAKPVENVLSVTVVSPSALLCDGLSTGIFVNGAKLAKKLHSENSLIDVMIIRENPEDKSIVTEKFGEIWDNCNISRAMP
jgi:thiamine biosynthesis lipoprotein